MNIINKRKGAWRVIIAHTECPFITYPRCDVACKILEDRPEGKLLNANTYCCFENCPRKEV